MNYTVLLHATSQNIPPAYIFLIYRQPGYIHNLLNTYQPVRSLQSPISMSVGRCTFSYAAPQIRNAIPLNIYNSPSVVSFQHNFRTFYFAATG